MCGFDFMSSVKTIGAAAVICGVAATAAGAVTVSQTQTLDHDGQDLTFSFLNLGPVGPGATLTIASGIAQNFPNNVGLAGLDLDDPREFFDLSFDGVSQGHFNCGGAGGATPIPGATGGIDCDFSFDLGVADTFLNDGSLLVQVAFSSAVGDFGEADEVNLTLDYDLVETPLPASALLLGTALVGLYGGRRAFGAKRG